MEYFETRWATWFDDHGKEVIVEYIVKNGDSNADPYKAKGDSESFP